MSFVTISAKKFRHNFFVVFYTFRFLKVLSYFDFFYQALLYTVQKTLLPIVLYLLHTLMYYTVYNTVYTVLESSLNNAQLCNGGYMGREGQGMSQTKLSVLVSESVRYLLG